MYAEVGRGFGIVVIFCADELSRALKYQNAQRWVSTLACIYMISRLMSAIGWMFTITYWLDVCLVPDLSINGSCKVFCEGSLEVFILSKRGHPV